MHAVERETCSLEGLAPRFLPHTVTLPQACTKGLVTQFKRFTRRKVYSMVFLELTTREQA